jgi:hypothetical protein
MTKTFEHLRVHFVTSGVQHYDEGSFTDYPWGVHIVAIDQEDFITWHSIEQINVDGGGP